MINNFGNFTYEENKINSQDVIEEFETPKINFSKCAEDKGGAEFKKSTFAIGFKGFSGREKSSFLSGADTRISTQMSKFLSSVSTREIIQ